MESAERKCLVCGGSGVVYYTACSCGLSIDDCYMDSDNHRNVRLYKTCAHCCGLGRREEPK
jgi:hypothetical protein